MSFSSETNSSEEVKQFNLYVVNSHEQVVPNAEVFIDGQKAVFNSNSGLYQLSKELNGTFDLKIICQGYDTLYYPKLGDHMVGARIYLVQKGDHYFFYEQLKISYPDRSSTLLINLNTVFDHKSVPPDSVLLLLQPLFKQFSLRVVYAGFADSLAPESFTGNANKIIIAKNDSSAFDLMNSPELAALRGSLYVLFAGPVVMHDDNYYRAYTYTNKAIVRVNPYANMKKLEERLRTWGASEVLTSSGVPYEVCVPQSSTEGIVNLVEKMNNDPDIESVSTQVYFNSESD